MLRFLRTLAALTGLRTILRKCGLAGPFQWVGAWLTEPDERLRTRQTLEDLRPLRLSWPALFGDLPRPAVGKTLWVISSISAPVYYKLEGILARGLAEDGYEAVVVAPFYERWRRAYHALFGFRSSLDFTAFLAGEKDASAAEEAETFRRSPSTKTLLGLTYRNVDIGRIALSGILYANKFAKLELTGEAAARRVEEELAKVKRNVHAAEKMFAHRRPDIALITEKGVSPAAEIFGVCIANGIPVIQVANAQHLDSFAVKRYGMANRHMHIFSLSKESWSSARNMPWNSGFEKELLDEFASSYGEGRWFGRKFLHDGKRVMSPDEAKRSLGLDPTKKTAVVFSHVLWDATFFFGESLFENYEEWLTEVVKAAYRNPSLNWVIKLHPDLVWKLKIENHSGPLRDLLVINDAAGALPDHVKIVPPETYIDTLSFFGFTDYCLTVRGTIGIEMACRGIPVLTAGTGRYSGMGFTVDSRSTQEYLARLADLQNLPPMSANETELARRFAFTLFKMRPWSLRSFRMERRQISDARHPLMINMNGEPSRHADTRVVDSPDIAAFRRWVASGAEDFLVSQDERVRI